MFRKFIGTSHFIINKKAAHKLYVQRVKKLFFLEAEMATFCGNSLFIRTAFTAPFLKEAFGLDKDMLIGFLPYSDRHLSSV